MQSRGASSESLRTFFSLAEVEPSEHFAQQAPPLPDAVAAALSLYGKQASAAQSSVTSSHTAPLPASNGADASPAASSHPPRVEDHYSYCCSFDDPIVSVRGLVEIRAQFATVHKVFHSTRIVDFQLEPQPEKEEGKSSSAQRQHAFSMTVLYSLSARGPVFGIPQRTTLELDASDLVVRHHDEWLFVPDSLAWYFPGLISYPYRMWKRWLGWSSSGVARILLRLPPVSTRPQLASSASASSAAARGQTAEVEGEEDTLAAGGQTTKVEGEGDKVLDNMVSTRDAY